MRGHERLRWLAAGETLTAHLRQKEQTRPDTPNRELVRQAVSQFTGLFDPKWGGFSSTPKFPTPHNLIFLLRYAQLTNSERPREMALKTLDAMCRGGACAQPMDSISELKTVLRSWAEPKPKP